MRKILATLLLIGLALTAGGCGNSGEKNKNKDKDVPKPAKAEPTA